MYIFILYTWRKCQSHVPVQIQYTGHVFIAVKIHDVGYFRIKKTRNRVLLVFVVLLAILKCESGALQEGSPTAAIWEILQFCNWLGIKTSSYNSKVTTPCWIKVAEFGQGNKCSRTNEGNSFLPKFSLLLSQFLHRQTATQASLSLSVEGLIQLPGPGCSKVE